MKRRQFTRVLGLGLLGVRFPSLRRRTDDRFVERWSWAMGQPVHLQLFASDENEGFEAAQKAFAELRRVEGALSLFDDGSDLCEVNRHSGGLGPRVGSDLATVLERGLSLRARDPGSVQSRGRAAHACVGISCASDHGAERSRNHRGPRCGSGVEGGGRWHPGHATA